MLNFLNTALLLSSVLDVTLGLASSSLTSSFSYKSTSQSFVIF
jgi:hypothetical protein